MHIFFSVIMSALSQQQNRYMQLFVSDTGYMYAVPMKSKTEIVKAVDQFAKEIGVPTALILDPKGTQWAENLKKKASDIGRPLKYLECKAQWDNLA